MLANIGFLYHFSTVILVKSMYFSKILQEIIVNVKITIIYVLSNALTFARPLVSV